MPNTFDLSELRQFTGTEGYVLLNLINRPMLVPVPSYGKSAFVAMTDGVVYLRENANCYWLLDMIGSHMPTILKNERCVGFASIVLTKKGNGAVFTVAADSGERPIVTQEIEYTDFPFDSSGVFQLFGSLGEVGYKGQPHLAYVIMLRSEY